MTLANIALAQNLPIDVIMPAFPPGANQAGLQTLTAEFPASWDFWNLRFKLTNLTTAMISEFRILVNSSIIVRVPGTVWDMINALDNIPAYGAATSGILTWYFMRMGIRGGAEAFENTTPPKLFSGSSKDMALFSTLNCGSFDTKGYGIGSLRIEFDIVNTNAAPTIQCKALAGAPSPGGAGYVRRLEYQTPQVAANTSYEMSKNALLFGDVKHKLLNRLHFVPAAGLLDNFVVRHNGVQKLVRSSVENDSVINAQFIRSSQSANGMWTLDWTERTWGDEMLPIGDPGTDLQVGLTPDTAGNLRVYEDSLGDL